MPTDDEADRAAIIARRQRFIALALSGLAAACTSSDNARPTPCLDIKSPEDQQKARLHREAEERERLRQKQLEATPTPCLSPPPPRDPVPLPEPAADPKADPKAPPPAPH